MTKDLNIKQSIHKSLYLFMKLSLVFIILNFIIYYKNFDLYNFVLSSLISIFYCFFLGFGNSILALILDFKFDWIEETSKRLFYTILLSILYISIVCIGIDLLTIYFLDDANFHKIITIKHIAKNSIIIAISIALSAFFHAMGFMQEWKISIQEKEELKKQNIVSQYEALKNQIDPHFFFNSLNTLSALIDEDKILSQKYIKNLSNIYRYVLDNNEDEISTVEDEIEFCKKYIFLQEIRFENCIKLKIDVDNTFINNKFILSLSLQIIIENIFKHNIISEEGPITIRISNTDKHLEISNNIFLKDKAIHSNKLGLNNIKSRYKFFTNENIIITEDKNIFSIKIPLLTRES